MYMKEISDYVFLMMIALIVTIPLSFLKFKIEGDDKNNKTILKKVLIININNYRGYIGIKTENKSKIVGFINKKSIFPNNSKIKININNESIKINSFLIDIFVYTDDYAKYYDMIKFLNKE